MNVELCQAAADPGPSQMTWALSLSVGCQSLYPPSPFITITQPEILYSFYRFSIAAPLAWNSLPLDLRTANSLPPFKNNLKTFLFHWDFKLPMPLSTSNFGIVAVLLLVLLVLVPRRIEG